MTHATVARPDAPRRTLPPLSLIVLVVVGALVIAGMAILLRDPEVVPRVTVENPSALEVNVSVRPAADGARLILGTVAPGTRVTTRDVVDQGDEWIFGFSSGGIDGGTVRVSRTKLAGDDWRLVVPDAVINRLLSRPFVPAYR